MTIRKILLNTFLKDVNKQTNNIRNVQFVKNHLKALQVNTKLIPQDVKTVGFI